METKEENTSAGSSSNYLQLPLSPSWKNMAIERNTHPLPTNVRMPHTKHVARALVDPGISMMEKYRKTWVKALKDGESHQPLLKDWRRLFAHVITAQEFCSEDKRPAEIVQQYVHDCGEVNDSLRQNKMVGKKTKTALIELSVKIADEGETVLGIPNPVGRSKLLARIAKQRDQLHAKCMPVSRILTPHEFHGIRYDLRQLMYLHRGAWKSLHKKINSDVKRYGGSSTSTAEDTEQTDDMTMMQQHFRIFLHLLQLSERMGDLNDILTDTKSKENLFLPIADREDLLKYLNIEIL